MQPARTFYRTALATVAAAGILLIPGCSDDASTDTSDTGSNRSTTSSSTTQAGDADPADHGIGKVKATEVAELTEPIALVVRPGDAQLWAAEKAGTVRRLEVEDDGTLDPAPDPVLDLSDETSLDMEQGLLGMAFSTDGATLFVSYTDLDGTSTVAAYDVTEDDDGTTVDPDTRQVLLTQAQPFSNHNGGHLLVDSDNQLWLGLGDGGSGDDPDNNAQDPDTLLGKLIRVDLSGDEDHEIVALGLRNPWRFDIDPQDQVMWIADVGQNAIEEVNRIALADLDGANFGWSGYEGPEPYLEGDDRRPSDAVAPVFSYHHDDDLGGCSVTGGVVYRGTNLVGLDGAYLVSDYCTGWVQALLVGEDDAIEAVDLGLHIPSPSSFGTDQDGNVYVLSLEGTVFRLDPA